MNVRTKTLALIAVMALACAITACGNKAIPDDKGAIKDTSITQQKLDMDDKVDNIEKHFSDKVDSAISELLKETGETLILDDAANDISAAFNAKRDAMRAKHFFEKWSDTRTDSRTGTLLDELGDIDN